jgi:hypothetical protein
MGKRSLHLMLCMIILTSVTGSLFASIASAQDQESRNLGLEILDALVVRPISAGVSCLATALYLGTFPVTYIAGESKEAEKNLVEKPWRFTHGRALGEIDRYRDEVSEIGGPSLSKPSTY